MSIDKKNWLIIDVINWAEEFFCSKGFENPRREIEYILQDLLSCNRMDIYLRFDELLTKRQLKSLRKMIKRRVNHEPIQYITNNCDFYGREFMVDKCVFIPRPETEKLIDIALEKIKLISSPSILDVGTGSGCIAITLALEKKNSNIEAIDFSKDALNVAKYNSDAFGLKNIQFSGTDFFKKNKYKPLDLLISNPPYIPEHELSTLMPEVRDFEPSIALTDNSNGLSFYEKFAVLGKSIIKPSGSMILEVGNGNHPKKVEEIFKNHGCYNFSLLKDFNGDDRVLVVEHS